MTNRETEPKVIRILVVDDHPVVRTGIIGMLADQPDFEIVAEAEDGMRAVIAVRDHQPDVVLMDLRMPRLDGVAALEIIARDDDPPKVIVLTTYDADADILRAIEAGATG
ncbi:MAG: response regulator transcription factor, partial [Thermomicrobiales bacterium]